MLIITIDGDDGIVTIDLGGSDVTAVAGTITGLVHLGGIETDVTVT